MHAAKHKRQLAAMALVCLLAFALRVYRLGAQSLWYDEALSVFLASQPPSQTIAQSAVTDHPPLHALLLGQWMPLAGNGEFAARFLSVWFAVLAVALTYRLGRRLLGATAGALGALLLAGSAFAVWYAQETRGYSLLLALTLVMANQIPDSKFQISNSKVKIMALVAAGAAGLYTHYYAAFTLLAINAAFGIGWLCKTQAASRQWRSLLWWALGQGAIIAAFAPWLPAAWTQATTNTTFFPGRVGWQTVVGDTLRTFATGSLATSPPSAWAIWSLALLIALGLLASRAPRYKLVTLAMLMAVPVAAMTMLAWNKPKFAPRYLIMALPAFLLLASAGLETLRQGWRRTPRALTAAAFVAAGGIVFATDAVALYNTFYAPELARPDARSVANYITQHERPGDVIILLGGYQQPVFEYYYPGGTPLVPMPPGLMPPAQQPLDYGAATALEQAVQGKTRLWLVLWQNQLADPMNVIMNELINKSQRLGVGQEFHGMHLLLFDLNNHASFGAEPQYALDIDYAQPISLAGYDLAPTHAAPGQSISLALYWQANGKLNENYMIFAHLYRPNGSLAAQDDHIAGADSFPSSLWQTGTLVRNTFNLAIPPDAQPGVYKIIVGLYNEQGRLNTRAGADQTMLDTIAISGQ